MQPSGQGDGRYVAGIDAATAGLYRIDMTARAGGREVGTAITHVLRNDGVAEHFATHQHRAVLERLAAMTGGRYWPLDELDGLAAAIPYSKAGVVERQTLDLWNLPIVFLVLLLLKAVGMAAAAALGEAVTEHLISFIAARSLCCARLRMPLPRRSASRLAAPFTFIVAGLGGEPEYEQRFREQAAALAAAAEKAAGAPEHVVVLTGEQARRDSCGASCRRSLPRSKRLTARPSCSSGTAASTARSIASTFRAPTSPAPSSTQLFDRAAGEASSSS